MTVLYTSVPLKYVERQLDYDKPVFYDSETLSLYGEVVLAQFKQSGWAEALVVEYPDQQRLKDLVKQLWVVAYPIAYDIGLLGIQPHKIDDLQIACKSAYPLSIDFKLSTTASKFYVGIDKKEMQKSFLKKRMALSDEQLHYGALDVYALEWLWQQKEIQEVVQNNLSYKVDMKAQLLALAYQHNGLPVIASAWAEANTRTEKSKVDGQARLNEIVGRDLNVKSWKQKQECFPELPIDPKTGKQPTDAKAFKKLFRETDKEVYGLVLNVTKWRTELQDLEKYRESYIPSEDPIRIRTFFNVAGAITGRFTSKGGDRVGYSNIQNVGRHFKSIFGYEETAGRQLVSGDYGTAELIAGASILDIANMVEAINNGIDLHKSGVVTMFGIPLEEVTKEQRQAQKAINFGLIFGLGIERFVEYAYDTFGVKFTEDEARDIKAKYYKAYPEIARWHKETARKVKQSGFTVKTPIGRVVHPDRYTDALNIAIQSSVADCTKLATIFLFEDYPKLFNKGVMLVNTVHDSITLDVPNELVEEAEEALEKSMILAWNELQKAPMFKTKLPITVDIDKGLIWK